MMINRLLNRSTKMVLSMSPRLSLSDGRTTHFDIEDTETDHHRNGTDHAGTGPEWRSHAMSPRGECDQHVSPGFGERPAPLPVVIIDDHLLFGAVLRMALACKGILASQLSIAGGVPAILHQLDGAPRGLILLDLHLGHTENGRRIDGVELFAPLRTRGWTVLAITDSDDLGRGGRGGRPRRGQQIQQLRCPAGRTRRRSCR
jgi:hypothetical protein